MKILDISESGYSADILLRSQHNGNETAMWIKEPKWKRTYDGIIRKFDSWEDGMAWHPDLVLFDHSGMSQIWKRIKDSVPCFGGSEFGDKIEKDRLYARSLFNKLGFEKLESIRAKTAKEVINHLKSHHVKHVVKPNGKDKRLDSYHVIISDDTGGEDAIARLESYEEEGLIVEYYEIEERKKGIECAVSGWFIADGKGGGDWSGDININFEHKRYATGYPEGLGPLTGETGTACRYDSKENQFFKNTLAKLTPILSENNYRGQADISFIFDEGKFYPLECTFRLGYPSCMIESPLQISKWEDLWMNTAIGNSKFQNEVSRDWAIGVVMLVPGFPYPDKALSSSDGLLVEGISKDNIDNIHLVEVRKKNNKLLVAPGYGYPAVITGTGKTLDEAKRNCYQNISLANPKRFKINTSFWRTDIGDRVKRQEEDIYKFGILTKFPQLKIS